MLLRAKRKDLFDDIDLPPVPAGLHEHAAGVARTVLRRAPWLRPVDCVILTGLSLSHQRLYELHPAGRNLNIDFLMMLDLAGIGIVVQGGPAMALSAGFGWHPTDPLSGCDFEYLWRDVTRWYDTWMQFVYLPAKAHRSSGGVLSRRDEEILASMDWIRANSVIRPNISDEERRAVFEALDRLIDPGAGGRRAHSGELRRAWYFLLRQSPLWDTERLFLVKHDHSLGFDTRPVTEKGRNRDSGLQGVFGSAFGGVSRRREIDMPEVLNASNAPSAHPETVAAVVEAVQQLRDVRDACQDLPLMGLAIDRVEALEHGEDALGALTFLRAVALETAALKNRALQAAVLYELGREGRWTREFVAEAFGTTPSKVRSREREAKAVLERCRAALAA